MIYYAEVAADGTIIQQHDLTGAALEVLDPAWRALPGPIDWSARPNPASVLQWLPAEPAPTWKDPRTLDQARTAALAKPRVDIGIVVEDAVGGLTKEYEAALADARAFAASGYTEPAPSSVAKFAQKNPTMKAQSNTWAAQQVIGRADALVAAQAQMRDQRFDTQYDMRAATTLADLDAAVAVWDAFILSIRSQLGL